MERTDILAIGAHPDDVELGCGGTLIAQAALGRRTGVVDLTAGELGTRGSAELRLQEAEEAAGLLGLAFRENLHFRDGFFDNDEMHRLEVIRIIRKYKPEIVLAPALHDRHPDHGRAAALVRDAAFLSGLEKIATEDGGVPQQAWRPRVVYHYIQYYTLEPDVVVDISSHFEQKMKAVRAYRSQFYNPDSAETETLISSPAFLDHIRSRCVDLGRYIGATYGEGFVAQRYVGVEDIAVLR